LGLADLGTAIPWGEVVYLISVLLRDPTSWLQVSVNKWHHPISYEWTVLAAQYDLHAQVNSRRKPKPYPRPWPNFDPNVTRKGKPRADARALLERAKSGGLKWRNKPTPM
jgi:hypothetical protein